MDWPPPPIGAAGVGGGAACLAAAIGGMGAPPGGGIDDVACQDDARTLPILRDSDGTRFRPFREAVKSCKKSDFEDWPIPGPRSAPFVLNQIAEHAGGSPVQHSYQWRTNCKFQATDGPALDHLEWSKALEALLTYDQCDGMNLACCEIMCRNIQRVEDRHKDKILGALDEAAEAESSLFTSSSSAVRGGLVIDPRLQEWISSALSKEYQISKERRKAREERQLGRKEPKGKGKKDAMDE